MLGGIPLHPLLVHMPIGLLLFATLLLLGSLKWTQLKLFSLITLVVGLLSGIAAYLTGDGAEEFAESQLNVARDAIHLHEDFALYSLLTFGLSLALLLLHYRSKKKQPLLIASLVIAIIGSGLLTYAGHLGGQMVYVK
ncbi:hypothetical protein QK289_12285 [Exiguobacterium antarcticum]|uniref:DUF2231 domain-containing protein n=1 Tax=Exiguobacterium antarcticum TaxID=132920 RepID=A0ABT6R4Q3_9BACL|nr:DUF2231 domain-containing protein [Exiguobacterium antarcticum]MDI3235788.1 hypothetical protein [Exiguobacterium antarcticum]